MSKIAGLVLILLFGMVGVSSAQDTTDCETGTQEFEHALGTACVSENVERVVVLEWTYAEDLLALGIQPVGMADIERYNVWVDVPVELDENVVDVGTRQEPNLEVIAELEPDLILTASFRSLNNFGELNAIAPTIAFNPYPEDDTTHFDEMLTTLMTIAQAVGVEEVGEQVVTNLEDYFTLAENALIEAGRDGETFILSQAWIANEVATFRLFTDNAMAVQVLEQIGLDNAWDDVPQLYGFSTITFEGFAEIEDTNFFYVVQENENAVFADSSLWNSLPFVQSDSAYWLGGDVWLFGGPLSSQLIVATILDAMGVELPQIEPETTPEATEQP